MRLLAICLLALPVFSISAQIDISEFTDYPQYQGVKISPKGTYLAYTAIDEEDGSELLRVVTADSSLTSISSTRFSRETGIANFSWVNDERLILSPTRKFNGPGSLGFNQPTGEIFGIDADGGNFEVLFGIAAEKKSLGTSTSQGPSRGSVFAAGTVIDLLPDEPDWVIIQSIPFSLEGDYTQSYRLNVNSGRRRNLKSSPIKNAIFTTDANHEIRFAVGTNKDAVSELYFLDDNESWRLIATSDDEGNWVNTEAPWGDEGKMLVSNFNQNRMTGLSIWDPKLNQTESIFHHESVDISGVSLDHEGNPWVVGYVDHYPEYFYPDESHPLVPLHKQLRASFPSMDVRIVSTTEDLDKVVLLITGPQNAGDFVVLDVEAMQYLTRLPVYPNLLDVKLSRTDPIEFLARDGLSIRAYLTLPVGLTEQNLPMVVVPHGGPHGIYDRWGYDVQAQILANNGYLVLQVNFRGSGGRGKNFEEAGYRQWGAKIQDDITDAVKWAVNEGLADSERICLLGASFGGYSALTSAYREPDLYQCAIGMSGVYDLNLMYEKGDIQEVEMGISVLEKYLGTSEEELNRFSPTQHADLITAKVMLIHGRQDVRAPLKHAERMKDALENAGNPPEWHVMNDETHSLGSEQNRLESFANILTFLDAHIGK